MTSRECIEEITSQHKWYFDGPYSQPTAYRIVQRFKRGSITLNKLEEFLNAFGYVQRDGEWINTKVHNPVRKMVAINPDAKPSQRIYQEKVIDNIKKS